MKDYPSLSFNEGNGAPYIIGRWDVSFNQEVLESYEIKITFPPDYPNSLPEVFEVSNKIRRHIDMHLSSPNWNACLFVSHQRWEVWPIGSSFKKFLEIPVHNFFLGQAHFAALGYWPHKERSHFDQGIVEYYQEKFNTLDNNVVHELLYEATQPRTLKQKKCPCDKTTRLGLCHHNKVVEDLRQHQDPNLLFSAIDIFKKQRSM